MNSNITIARMERFSRFFTVVPGGCWPWHGHKTSKGYGDFSTGGKTYRAHRLLKSLMTGGFDSSLICDHECHNKDESCAGGPTCLHRSCVNPAHIRLTDTRTNVLSGKGVTATRARKTVCMNGHSLSGENLMVITATGYRRCRTCTKVIDQRVKRKIRARNKAIQSAINNLEKEA